MTGPVPNEPDRPESGRPDPGVEPGPHRRERGPAQPERLDVQEVAEEVTVPPTDPVREAKERDLDDPAHVDVDPEEWRQGGPTRSPGAVTTTGGSAGPASVRRTADDEAAPTTPGDATSGGMEPPSSGTASDASGTPLPSDEPERRPGRPRAPR